MRAMKTTLEQLAYWAGFFDGEGCIGLYCGKSGWNHKITLSQKRIEPLKDLERLFGGRAHLRTDKAHQWDICGSQAAAFLTAVLPFLRNKARQARLYLVSRALTGRRSAIRRKARLMIMDLIKKDKHEDSI